MQAPLSRHFIQINKYVVIGSTSIGIYLIVSILLQQWLSLHILLASGIAFGLSTLFNYIGHYVWTYDTNRHVVSTLWRYAVTVLIGFGYNYVLIKHWVPRLGLNVNYATWFFAATWPVCSFFILKLAVFEKREKRC